MHRKTGVIRDFKRSGLELSRLNCTVMMRNVKYGQYLSHSLLFTTLPFGIIMVEVISYMYGL